MESPQTGSNTAASILSLINPALTSERLADAAKTTESIDTVQFAFHPWADIPNISLQGFGKGIQHPILRRLSAIPLMTWKTPNIIPRAGGFTVGSITSGGAFPSGSVGSKNEPRLQFPSESAANFLIAWGNDGLCDIGGRILHSLTAHTDRDKLESLAVFRAVMETGPHAGADLVLEQLPEFLEEGGRAYELLRAAVRTGVNFGTEQQPNIVPMGTIGVGKGQKMIREISGSIVAATLAGNRILDATKSDLADAKIGVKDVKRKLDLLDKWLLKQFPSFSLDSEVERAAQATAPLGDAIRTANENQAITIEQLMEMQARTLAQLTAANETNARLVEKLITMQTGQTGGQQEATPAP